MVKTGGLEKRFRRLSKALKNQLNPFASRHLAEEWASLPCFSIVLLTAFPSIYVPAGEAMIRGSALGPSHDGHARLGRQAKLREKVPKAWLGVQRLESVVDLDIYHAQIPLVHSGAEPSQRKAGIPE